MHPRLTYGDPGATHPANADWPQPPAGYRAHESTVVVGRGSDAWERASVEILDWAVKTRSGFTVSGAGDTVRALVGGDYLVRARIGPFTVTEPVRVVSVVDLPARRGFAYGTLPGHPVSGEEAFVVHQAADDTVVLTLRSLTRPPRGRWRAAYPAVLVAQRWYRRRYRRALRA